VSKSSLNKECEGTWQEQLAQLPFDKERAIETFYALLVLSKKAGNDGEFIELICTKARLSPAQQKYLVQQPSSRLLIYRQLVRATLMQVLELAMPRAIARLGSTFETIFEDFLDSQAFKSRFLRDITPIFLDYYKAHVSANVPRYIGELAQLEAARISVAAQLTMTPHKKPVSSDAPDQIGLENQEHELALELGLQFTEASELLEFSYAVHQLPEAVDDKSVPPMRPTYLLAYRDPQNDIRYMDLSPLASSLLHHLKQGAHLGDAIEKACSKLGQALSPEVLNGCATLLANLSERGLVLGVR